jgi:hypothetical protein
MWFLSERVAMKPTQNPVVTPGLLSKHLHRQETGGALAEAIGDALIIHGECRRIAERLHVSMTEFNTGLFWFGETSAAR